MGNALQEQLLKAGLVKKDKLQQAKSAKKKQARQKGAKVVDQAKLNQQKANHEKIKRDQELNRRKEEKAKRRALRAQINQLIEPNIIPRDEGEIAFHFQQHNKIKKIFVTEAIHQQLVADELAIVHHKNHYQVIPLAIAAKLAELDKNCLVTIEKSQDSKSEAQDDYADFPVPDDLMW